MLLALDIGNTNISIGVFDESGGPPDYRPGATWRIATDRARLADEYGLLIINLLESKGLSAGEIDSVAMCSGVPPLTGYWSRCAKPTSGPSRWWWGPGSARESRCCTTARATWGPTGSRTRPRR